ncbi:MAG: helicase HerA-like domain-containing protein, partial [Candidatus Limnocylindrales bacterium]
MEQDFVEAMQAGYALGEPACIVGSPTRGGEVAAAVRVQMALAMANRHGLIAGATGTGKTKTLQILAGELSDAGVPVFISDIKG